MVKNVVARFREQAEGSPKAFKRKKRQKGLAKIKRRQSYRRNRSKSKRQSTRWRAKNPSKVKRYQRKYRKNPSKYHMRHAETENTEALALNIPVIRAKDDQEGTLIYVDDDEMVIRFADDAEIYDPVDFIDDIIIPDEEDEEDVLKILDEFYPELDTEKTDD